LHSLVGDLYQSAIALLLLRFQRTRIQYLLRRLFAAKPNGQGVGALPAGVDVILEPCDALIKLGPVFMNLSKFCWHVLALLCNLT
jgi:hypothetical protein